jgi:hypothetical protein
LSNHTVASASSYEYFLESTSSTGYSKSVPLDEEAACCVYSNLSFVSKVCTESARYAYGYGMLSMLGVSGDMITFGEIKSLL